MNPTCDIDGCRQDAVATVRSNNSASSRALAVCHDCRDELTNVFGFELVYTVEGLDAA